MNEALDVLDQTCEVPPPPEHPMPFVYEFPSLPSCRIFSFPFPSSTQDFQARVVFRRLCQDTAGNPGFSVSFPLEQVLNPLGKPQITPDAVVEVSKQDL